MTEDVVISMPSPAKAAANVELFNVLGDVAGDGDLARLVSSAARRLHLLILTLGPTARPGRWSGTSEACTT